MCALWELFLVKNGEMRVMQLMIFNYLACLSLHLGSHCPIMSSSVCFTPLKVSTFV